MKQSTGIKAAVALVAVLVIGVVGAFKFLEKIDNGYVGVRYSMNGGIKDEALTQGVKFVGIDKVIQYPIRLQTIQAKNVSVSTSDGKKRRSTSNMIIRLIQPKRQKCIKSSETSPAKTLSPAG